MSGGLRRAGDFALAEQFQSYEPNAFRVEGMGLDSSCIEDGKQAVTLWNQAEWGGDVTGPFAGGGLNDECRSRIPVNPIRRPAIANRVVITATVVYRHKGSIVEAGDDRVFSEDWFDGQGIDLGISFPGAGQIRGRCQPELPCGDGCFSVCAVPYIPYQVSSTWYGKNESVPCRPSQDSESGPGSRTTPASLYGPPMPFRPLVCETARQIRPSYPRSQRGSVWGCER